MLSRRLPLVLPCALLWLPCVGAADLPYVGIINRDGAPVRSGPGEEYYATDALRRGDRVEVHRIDEGGWCAIRPPAGSFSLVLEKQLHMTDTPRLAEVAGNNTRAFVGSRVRGERDVVQVVLNRGEFVEIVGADELSDEKTGKSQTWYRIAPPAGEFRWVHLEFIDREDAVVSPPVEVAASGVSRNTEPTAELLPVQEGGNATAARTLENRADTESGIPLRLVQGARWKPLPAGTLDKRWGRTMPENEGLQQRMELNPGRMAVTGESPSGVAEASAEIAPGLLGHVDTKPVPGSMESSAPGQPGLPGPIQPAAGTEQVDGTGAELAELDVEFSLMVAKPVSQWQLDPLMLRADSIARQAKTPEIRDRALELLGRMRQFHQLQYPTAPLGMAFTPGAVSGGPSATAGPAAASAGASEYLTRAAARGPSYPPPTGGLPRFLTALESLMPPPPAPPAGVPAGESAAWAMATTPPPATSRQLVAAASIQTPETAPPDPAVTGSLPPTTDLTASGSAAWRAAGPGSANLSLPPQTADGSEGMLDRIKNTLLYPLGAGPTSATTSASANPAYDGQGWLVPIVSRHGHRSTPNEYMPPFALTDQDGNIQQFVTPAPGVNLYRYLRQEIGVFGQQHPLPNLNQPHITASRIVALDRHRR